MNFKRILSVCILIICLFNTVIANCSNFDNWCSTVGPFSYTGVTVFYVEDDDAMIDGNSDLNQFAPTNNSDKTSINGLNTGNNITTNISSDLLNTTIIQPSLNIVESFYINSIEVPDNLTSQRIKGNDNLIAKYTITNSGPQTQSVKLFLCIYNLEDAMIDMTFISDTLAANETKNIEKNLTVPSDISVCYAKVFLWDGLSMLRPLHEPLQIGSENVSEEVATATVDCVLNGEYNLITTIENMPESDSGQYTIKYNPSKLEIVDLCSLTYKKELSAGTINGTDINIISVDTAKGEIVFKNPNDSNGKISKVLNSFKFRGLVSNEQTTITIE